MGKKRQGRERRKHDRVPLNLLVQFRSDDYDQFFEKYAGDISLGGIFIATDHPREMGSMVYFQFTTKTDGPLIEGLGSVVRVTDGEGGEPRGIGIEFLSLDDQSRSQIHRLIAERESAEKGQDSPVTG